MSISVSHFEGFLEFQKRVTVKWASVPQKNITRPQLGMATTDLLGFSFIRSLLITL